MSEQETIDSFVAKWRDRWPEWQVAEVFVPAELRPLVLAWASLQQELTDAAWGGSDPRPGEAKLGWWMEELQGWTRGIRRHPLGLILQKHEAPWASLVAALPGLRDSRERPVDANEAGQQVQALAQAIADIESPLFGVSRAGDIAGDTTAIATSLLHMRLAHHPAEAAPLQVVAGAGEAAATAAWARQLAERGSRQAVTRPRRLWAGLALARLQQGQPGRPLSLPRALWVSWRSARPGGDAR